MHTGELPVDPDRRGGGTLHGGQGRVLALFNTPRPPLLLLGTYFLRLNFPRLHACRFAIMSTIETVTQHPEITAENVLRLFPEVNTTLIGGSHNSATSDNALQGYDEEQIRLMDEVCIVLDNNDIPIGSATKKLCKWLQRDS